MNKNRSLSAVLMLFVLMAITRFAPAASAGWEPGLSTPLGAATGSGTEQTCIDLAAFRAEVVRLINLERAKNGLNALEPLRALDDLADIRANESSVLFSHTRPNGKDGLTIFSDHNFAYRVAGENLSSGFSSPAKLVAAWMHSKSHRGNILSGKFIRLGAGLYVNAEKKIYCSLLFYTPASS